MIADTSMGVIKPKGPAFPSSMITKDSATDQKLQELIIELAQEKKKYRKLTKEELAMYGIALPSNNFNNTYAPYRAFVKKFYGSKAVSAAIGINSEYNDCTYDNRLTYIVVYDALGNEMLPLKETAQQSRKEWSSLISDGDERSDEQRGDIHFFVTDNIPDLYVLNN
jgi:hypothetical protein